MKIAIIGAGITGLSAAYDLAKAGQDITIYEAENQVGGLASGFKEPNWEWSLEHFYHHWFASDEHILGLIEELGLSHKTLFPRPYTVLLHNQKWYPFDGILQALMFPGLGWGINKIRFGLVGLYLRLSKNWQSLEKTTVDTWMRKWAGDKVYETMWEPMLKGKFGPHYKEVNMAWMWARFHARTSRLGTYQGGFQAFADDLAGELRQLGVRVQTSTSIPWVTPSLTVGASPTGEEYDQILVTTSPQGLANLCPQLPNEYQSKLRNLKSMGAVVLILALKHQLSTEGYYWYNLPVGAGFPYLALVEHTNYLTPKYFGGDHIIYCGDYRDLDHEYFTLTKEEILERFLPSLKEINAEFSPDWVKNSWVFRSNYAQPVPGVNHSRNIPPIETPISGLYFASMSQVYPWDRGTNFAVEIGRRAARQMLAR